MLDILSVQGNTDTPWEKKIEKVFWRGRDSSRERLDLIDISRKHPDLFNASITNFFFFKNEIDKYGPGQSHVSFFDFFKVKEYDIKYIILTIGIYNSINTFVVQISVKYRWFSSCIQSPLSACWGCFSIQTRIEIL